MSHIPIHYQNYLANQVNHPTTVSLTMNKVFLLFGFFSVVFYYFHIHHPLHCPHCGNYLVTTFRNKNSQGKSECKLRSLIPKMIEPSESSRGHAICSLKEQLHSSENNQSSGLGVWD